MPDGAATADLELRLRWLTVTVVASFGIALLAGTVLSLVSPGSLVALRCFQTGLVLLMAAPAVRILIAVAERIRRQDWTFVLMTLVVLVELSIVLWRAAAKS
jgi:maltodextrin utilization protein YvdJ